MFINHSICQFLLEINLITITLIDAQRKKEHLFDIDLFMIPTKRRPRRPLRDEREREREQFTVGLISSCGEEPYSLVLTMLFIRIYLIFVIIKVLAVNDRTRNVVVIYDICVINEKPGAKASIFCCRYLWVSQSIGDFVDHFKVLSFFLSLSYNTFSTIPFFFTFSLSRMIRVI